MRFPRLQRDATIAMVPHRLDARHHLPKEAPLPFRNRLCTAAFALPRLTSFEVHAVRRAAPVLPGSPCFKSRFSTGLTCIHLVFVVDGYRLSQSEFADRFILKGAALLLLWLGEPIRPTKDVDLLGFGNTSAEALKRMFVTLCTVEVPEDGLTFLADSVQVEAIREEQEYGGMRVKVMAMLRNVRIPLQVDVGAGDAVVPPPEVLNYPGLLDLPRARLGAYRPETSIAEKREAMVRLALANSRMKDFFDIHRLAETRTFDGDTMRLAVAATFTRRGVEVPSSPIVSAYWLVWSAHHVPRGCAEVFVGETLAKVLQ